MPPKKKGKGKKKKELQVIEDDKMLRLIGEHKEGTVFRLKLCYEKRDGPIQLNVVISDLSCVHHLYRELWRRLDIPWGKEYIFISTLPKSEQNSFTLGMDGGKGLADLGIKNGDMLVFVEANNRALGEYTKKRIEVALDDIAAKMANEKANLLIAKKENKHADDIAALEKNIEFFEGEFRKFTEYKDDYKAAFKALNTFEIGEEIKATPQEGKKAFKDLPIEQKQELENLKKEGLDILASNRAFILKQKEKAEKAAAKKKKKKK